MWGPFLPSPVSEHPPHPQAAFTPLAPLQPVSPLLLEMETAGVWSSGAWGAVNRLMKNGSEKSPVFCSPL